MEPECSTTESVFNQPCSMTYDIKKDWFWTKVMDAFFEEEDEEEEEETETVEGSRLEEVTEAEEVSENEA